MLQNKYTDIIGKRFGKLIVLEKTNKKTRPKDGFLYLCQCDCGGKKEAHRTRLVSGHAKSCGCLRFSRKNGNDIIGIRYCRLVVVRKIDKNYYLCKCDCNNTVKVTFQNLRSQNTRSCGCLLKDFIFNTKRTHGRTSSKEYRAWNDMKNRCYNKKVRNYNRYGGRGIQVCERWLNSFENFFADMGAKPTPKHSIERRDNNQSYSPENCYWATLEEQANNKERSLHIAYQDRKATLAQWSRILNLNYKSTWNRIYRDGWSVEKAFAASINT